MGLTGFNRQRRQQMAEAVGADLADELIGMGITDVQKLDRLDEVSAVLGLSEKETKAVKAKVAKARKGGKRSEGEAEAGDKAELLEEMTNADVAEYVSGIDQAQELEELLAVEQAGQDRKGAKKAIQARIDELSAPEGEAEAGNEGE